ncbi:hypothetical protein O6221_23530, partial [Salmonella enterica subsp. enterica]
DHDAGVDGRRQCGGIGISGVGSSVYVTPLPLQERSIVFGVQHRKRKAHARVKADAGTLAFR